MIPFPAVGYPTNTPLADLTTAELLALISTRLWAQPYRLPHLAAPDWRAGFNAAGIDAAAIDAFDQCWLGLVAAISQPLEVRCRGCRTLADDEARFLRILALLQDQQFAAAKAILQAWVPAGAARIAALLLESFAAGLLAADLKVPLRLEAEEKVSDLLRDLAQRGPDLWN